MTILAEPMNSSPAAPVIELTQYQSSALASGVVAAFCVALAWRPAMPFQVGAPPARSVAPFTSRNNTSTVSPAAVVAARVMGDVVADERVRTVEPKVCAI
jgi:hypothetical protein